MFCGLILENFKDKTITVQFSQAGFGMFGFEREETAAMPHIAEKLSGLLQQSHQAALSEVASRAHAVLVWGQDVIRHRGLLQHVGGDVLRVENSQPINQISRLNQIFNHVADFKRRCPTVENGTNLMSVQSMTCCLQVTGSRTTSADYFLCFTQSIDTAVAMVTMMIACYRFNETVCSQRPTGAHFYAPPLPKKKNFKGIEASGIIFLD